MEISTNSFSPWHIPQRQSPAAIFLILGKVSFQLLKFFWPILALYFLRNEKEDFSFWYIWIVPAFGILSLLGTMITYWFNKFHIREDHLIVQSGWLRKKKLSIPFQNIQAVHLEQNVWQQLLGVAKVSFDATGSEKVEVQLDALAVEKAEELKKLLTGHAQNQAEQETKTETQSTQTFKLSFPDLLKLSLTANHLEAFLLLLAFSFNLVGEIKRIFDFDEQEYFNTYVQELVNQTSFIAFVLLSLVATVSLLFSIVRVLFKFFDFSLTDNGQSWKINHGLFNRQQRSIPLNKIQIISWRTSWLRRKFDYWIVLVQSVGHSRQSRKQQVQIPILAFSQLVKLAESYQEFKGIDPAQSRPIEPDYWKRKSLILGFALGIIPTIALWFWVEWWSLSFLILPIYITGHYYVAYKNFRWQTVPAGLQLLSGAWGRKYTLLNWSKIQQVHIQQSPYQRRKHLANIIFITAGGKVVLPYLSLATATELADSALYEVESKNEPWM